MFNSEKINSLKIDQLILITLWHGSVKFYITTHHTGIFGCYSIRYIFLCENLPQINLNHKLHYDDNRTNTCTYII